MGAPILRRERPGIPRSLVVLLFFALVVTSLLNSYPAVSRVVGYEIAREMTRIRVLQEFAGWEVLENPYFTVYHRPEDAAAGRLVLETAMAVYRPVVEILAYEPTRKVPIVVHPSREELAESFGWSTHDGALGVYWAGVIQILSPSIWLRTANPARQARLFLENGPIAHEFAHVVVDYKARGNYPRWLSEGIAQYIEYKLYGVIWRDQESALEQPLYTLAELDDFSSFPDQSLAYRQAFSLVLYMVETWGEECLPALLEELGRGAFFDRAMKKVTGCSLEELEADWLAWLEKNPRGW